VQRQVRHGSNKSGNSSSRMPTGNCPAPYC
jgi:hypothetical protein